MHRWPYYAFYAALCALLFVGAFVFIVGDSLLRGNGPDHSALTWVKVVLGLVVVSILGGGAIAGILVLSDWLKTRTQSTNDDASA